MRSGRKSNIASCVGIVAAVAALCLPAEAGRRRDQHPQMVDPEMVFSIPPWMLPYESPWGPGLRQSYGFLAPVGGSWDDLLKSGPTAAIGATWKYAEWSGDLLPPSSTLLHANYRYAFMKGDTDVQLHSPGGAVDEVVEMRFHMLEAGATQRFNCFMRGHGYVDTGLTFGLGGATGRLNPVAVDPTKDALYVSARRDDGVVIRGAWNTGVGLQFGRFDFRFGLEGGLIGSNALGNGLRSQGTFGMNLGGTIYFD